MVVGAKRSCRRAATPFSLRLAYCVYGKMDSVTGKSFLESQGRCGIWIIRKKIGVFIRQARERQNITKETLARSLQISEAELSAWRRSILPALTQAPALARELAVSLDELFNARYHTVAQDYQASEACFLREQPQPADAPDQDETKERPRCRFLWKARFKAGRGCRLGQGSSLQGV